MYLPAAFTESDLAFVASFVDAHPLATLVIAREGGATIDHIPFMRLGELAIGGSMIAHAARANELWRIIGESAAATLVFTGASTYVSPSWYPSKKIHHEVVPTWNYVAIHLQGTLRCQHDDVEKRSIVDALTRKMEAPLPISWNIDEAPAPYITKMLAGIVGLTFQIESIVAKIKASQNRTIEDRRGVESALRANNKTHEVADIVGRYLGDD